MNLPALRRVYLAHPLAGDTAGNIARAKRWLRWCYRHHYDVAVLAPWILEVEVLEERDSDPVIREGALVRCEAVVALCDEIWLVGGAVSSGMRRELRMAVRAGKRVVDLRELGPEPPEEYDGRATARVT